MLVHIDKGSASGIVSAPPSKSMAHRLLICAAMAKGVSHINGISECEDVSATLDCLRALGIQAEKNGSTVTVTGQSITECSPSAPLFCKESGSTLRFFIPIALVSGKNTIFYGADSLMKRPMSVYKELCERDGLAYIEDGTSIAVKGPLKPGNYSVVGNISSQFISGLLFALPVLNDDSRIKIIPPIESKSYIELTISALSIFGVKVEWEDEHTLFIRGNQQYIPCDIEVEGDYSGAAFTDALNLFGGEVEVLGLNPASLQGDKSYKKFYEMLNKGVPTIHIGNCPDLGPILFAVSAAKHGGVFTGTKRLKIKESDRAEAMATELKKFGTSVTVYEDKVVVYPAAFHAPSELLHGHNDHRIVMALSVLLSLTGGDIAGAEAVKKSYPAFFEDLKKLGIGVCEYDD